MAEYIEREALMAEIEANINTYWNEGHGGYYLAEDALNESVKTAPAADVVEVRHGYWKDNRNGTFTCSVCGGNSSKMDWCGRCGAKMDGKEDNK